MRDALPPEMLATFFFTLACTLVLAAVMIAIRYRIETLQDEREDLFVAAQVVPARQPEAAR